jgi:hypothetical protein
METGTHPRQPGDGGALAPIGIRTLLARHLQTPPGGRQEENFERGSPSGLSDGGGKPDLGRTAVPRQSFVRMKNRATHRRQPQGRTT